jgi:lysophospholipase L1-like esterase
MQLIKKATASITAIVVIATIAVNANYHSEGITFRKYCSAAVKIRFETSYSECRCKIFKASTFRPDFVALGDSITEQQNWAARFPHIAIANRGIGGNLIGDMLNRVDLVDASRPKTVLLMAGINDFIVQGRTAEVTFEDYAILVRHLKKLGIDVIIQSTLLCNEKIDKYKCNENLRDKIHTLNHSLVSFAATEKLTFVDLNHVLAPDGVLLAKYSYDGEHLNDAGNSMWAKTLLPFM